MLKSRAKKALLWLMENKHVQPYPRELIVWPQFLLFDEPYGAELFTQTNLRDIEQLCYWKR